MPEIPDLTVYVEAVRQRAVGQTVEALRVKGPFVLRSVDPPPQALHGKRLLAVDLIGKRIVLGFEDEIFAVVHLMIAGRLHWKDAAAPLTRRVDVAAVDFSNGTLLLTEAGTTRRASLHLVRGHDALRVFDRGGLDVMAAPVDEFARRLRSESHTVKRALTDPRLFSGIGNAYSDEILHRARLSPVALTGRLTDEEVEHLWRAARIIIDEWTARLREQAGNAFPEKVTAFRPEMAVHGKFGQPCPVCATAVQRIRYASNETNYCPRCQTGGRLLADRALSRLLKQDWPRSIDEL